MPPSMKSSAISSSSAIRRALVGGAAVALIFAAAGLGPRPALADEPNATAKCMFKAIHALPGNGGIDPRITRLRDYLLQPPFSSWHTFKLLSEKEAEIKEGASATYPLPHGKSASVVYKSHDQAGNAKHRVRGELTIEGPKATHTTGFALDEGGFFVVAGEKYEGGILIYSLSCQTEK